MNIFIKSVLDAVVAAFLTACGVSTADYDKVVANRDQLYTKLVAESKLLEKAKSDLDTKRVELAAEIKAKQSHAVREEQAKQRLKQAERDLAAALRELSVWKSKRK